MKIEEHGSEDWGKAVTYNKPTIEPELDNIKYCPMEGESPTIQEDLWKQFAKEYSQLHSLDLEQVRYWFIPLIEFGKQNYTLIKK